MNSYSTTTSGLAGSEGALRLARGKESALWKKKECTHFRELIIFLSKSAHLDVISKYYLTPAPVTPIDLFVFSKIIFIVPDPIYSDSKRQDFSPARFL